LAPSRPSERPADQTPLAQAFFEKRENLLLFLAARTRCMATAEDLLQDLYIKVAAVSADEADVRAPSALLYRMAANILVDHVRSTQRSSKRSADWRRETRASVGDEEVSSETPADEAVISRERVRLLAEAVAGLPPQMGKAFRLHKLEGRSQKETAQAMGVSVKMIEQHIQAAVRQLSQKLRT
jgi:RNA polymerase sigma factor (sigma-70 family)